MYRYSSGESSFIMIDGRNDETSRFSRRDYVHAVCLALGDDGVAIIEGSDVADFKLTYVPDGVRECPAAEVGACAVAFADLLGIKPFHTQDYTFEMEGSVRKGFITRHLGESKTVLAGEGPLPCPTECLGEFEIK